MTTKLKILEYEDCPTLSDQSMVQKIVPHCEYSVSSDGQTAMHRTSTTSSWKIHAALRPSRILRDLFLPVGYPHSVRPEYMAYQFYDSLQGLCSYLRGVVSTSAVLTAAGVGNADATAMSAAMTWAMRDGLGMIGGLLFSYTTSSLFDSYVKEFRLFADVINDVGLTLDMVSPYVGNEYVLYVTSASTLCKVMCGMAAGATKGSITQHFCLRGNMADLNAKESTQETLVSLVGMILGIVLARYLHSLETNQDTDKPITATVTWSIFILLTLVHVWANYIGVKLLRLRTLNRERAQEALGGVIHQLAGESLWSGKNASPPSYSVSVVPIPEQLSESIWSSARSIIFPGYIRLGVRFATTLSGISQSSTMESLQEEFGSENYVLGILPDNRTVCVSLRVGATDRTELKAFVHASTVRQCITQGALLGKKDTWVEKQQLISRTHTQVNILFGKTKDTPKGEILSLEALEKKGWDVSRLYLGFGRWRIQWNTSKTD